MWFDFVFIVVTVFVEIQDSSWQSSLGNFLLFLKRVAAASAIQKHLTSRKWISRILSLTGQFDESGKLGHQREFQIISTIIYRLKVFTAYWLKRWFLNNF